MGDVEQRDRIAGMIGQPPVSTGQDLQITLDTLGRLAEVEQFEQIVLKTMPDGRVVRLRDVARVELGARNQDITCRFMRQECAFLIVFQTPDANALDVRQRVQAKMDELARGFPEDIEPNVAFDTTPYTSESIREVFKTLEASPINFVGNVEGRDLYNGHVDVVVTDGFTGNVALKISESLADMIVHLIREELTRTPLAKLGALLVRPAFRRFWKRVDYTELGGAPLLGINGACIISHGASPPRAVKNAIRVAAEWVRMDVNSHIRAALAGEFGQSLADSRRTPSEDH